MDFKDLNVLVVYDNEPWSYLNPNLRRSDVREHNQIEGGRGFRCICHCFVKIIVPLYCCMA